MLDEVPQSYSHQGNLELNQTRYTAETRDHESVNSEVTRLFPKICAFCEEEGHVIMDCPFVFFHIKADIIRHKELQIVAVALMDQSQEHELGILVVQNRLKGTELGGQLGPQNQYIHPSIQFKSRMPKVYSHPHYAP